jgi:hypothetical protein
MEAEKLISAENQKSENQKSENQKTTMTLFDQQVAAAKEWFASPRWDHPSLLPAPGGRAAGHAFWRLHGGAPGG